jgi:predicted Zn-dependent protease
MAAGSRRLRAAIAAALPLWLACVQDDGSRFNPIRQIVPVIDEHAERELGWQFDQALLEAVPVIDDPVVTGFLSDLGQTIVRELGPQPFVYRFRIIEDSSLNAFAVPGGFVYFHTGTILAAGSIDELAGVMGHEIAHVKAHHYARMRQEQAIPDLATQIVGMAAAVATREPGLLLVAQGINVSMQLRYSREAEAEADQLGAIWMSRAGFAPAGITRFFERILDIQRRQPSRIPPYLYSHPAVEERIEAVRLQAEGLEPVKRRDPDWNERLGRVQARLGLLLDLGRNSLPPPAQTADTRRTDPLLAEADARAQRGEIDAALLSLARAEQIEPNDPRVSYRIGELLQASGRPTDAAEAFRRTLRLDPSRALVFFKLGQAYKEVGNRQQAVFAFEQASWRGSESSGLRGRARWEVEKLTFPVVLESGFSDRIPSEILPPAARDGFTSDAPRMGWWGRLGPHFVPHADRLELRWLDPQQKEALRAPPMRMERLYLGSVLEPKGPLAAGRWTVEVLLDGDVVRRDAVTVSAAEPER